MTLIEQLEKAEGPDDDQRALLRMLADHGAGHGRAPLHSLASRAVLLV